MITFTLNSLRIQIDPRCPDYETVLRWIVSLIELEMNKRQEDYQI